MFYSVLRVHKTRVEASKSSETLSKAQPMTCTCVVYYK